MNNKPWTNKSWNTITKSKWSSNAGCMNQKNQWKDPLKINLWQNEFVLYLIQWAGYYNSINSYCFFYDHPASYTCFYRCLWRKRKSCCFCVIIKKIWTDIKKSVEQANRCHQRLAGKAVEELLTVLGIAVVLILR